MTIREWKDPDEVVQELLELLYILGIPAKDFLVTLRLPGLSSLQNLDDDLIQPVFPTCALVVLRQDLLQGFVLQMLTQACEPAPEQAGHASLASIHMPGDFSH